MPERHIEAGARRSDLDVGGYHGLAAAYRGPHRLSQHPVDARAAARHPALEADQSAPAVRACRPIEQFDELRHQSLTEHRSCFEQRLKIIDEPSGEGVANHGHADRTHDGSRRGDAEFRENQLAHRDDLADVDHPILLRISTTALLYRTPSP